MTSVGRGWGGVAAAIWIVTAAPAVAQSGPQCAAGASRCGEALSATCLESLGAGAIAAGGDCATQAAAYRQCLSDFVASCETVEQPFIGALDGDYQQEDGFMRMAADFATQELTFLAGNCALTTQARQEKGGYELSITATDGICAFLGEVEDAVDVMRIIPKPRALANSGRLLKFYLETRAFALQDFAGDYALR